jgi:hypothetical protein
MIAGSTIRNISEQAIDDNSWSACPADHFELRVGPNYDKNKQKRPSPDSLMTLVGME